MEPAPSAEITGLLQAWAGGDRAALERLTPLVYNELRRRARRCMANQSPVNEAFLRLVGADHAQWQDRVRPPIAVRLGFARR